MDPTISEIKTRNSAAISTEEVAARKIAQVVKDQDSRATIRLINTSNAFCRAACGANSMDGEHDDIDSPRRYPQVPCRLVVIDQSSLGGPLSEAHASLESDGLKCEFEIIARTRQDAQVLTAPSEITGIIRDIQNVMTRCHHALHRGYVYAKPEKATLTFLQMMDVKTYINKLLANDALRERILKNMSRIVQLLSHPACEIIPQIHFDADYIEVSGGQLFCISTRSFTESAPKLRFAKISPRAYIPYDTTTPPRPVYFKDGIMNSFPDLPTRTAFLNKFYQCLVGRRMPQKIRKLVVSGPKDSGKTSWACVLHRIVPSHRIASITNERQFSSSMINDATELVVIDDWSAQTMHSDLAKTLLQGGWLVTAVKHQEPKCLWNNCPFYITTNAVPDFGGESDNIRRRIAVFETKSLPSTTAGIDKWIYDNAMECLVWVADQINKNIDLVAIEERWYEDADGQNAVIDVHTNAR